MIESKFQRGEDENDICTDYQEIFDDTTGNSIEKLDDKGRVNYRNFLKSPNYEDDKASGRELESKRYNYNKY